MFGGITGAMGLAGGIAIGAALAGGVQELRVRGMQTENAVLTSERDTAVANTNIVKAQVSGLNKTVDRCLANSAGLITTVKFHQDQAQDAEDMYNRRLEDINNYQRSLGDAVNADPVAISIDASERRDNRMQLLTEITGRRSGGGRDDRETDADVPSEPTGADPSPEPAD